MIAFVITALGVIYALFCLFLAFLNAGAGHGWISAFWISLPGTPLIVAGFHACGRWREPGTDRIAKITLALLVLLDLALLAATRNEGVRYLEYTGAGGQLWIALWLLAHVPPVTALYWRSELPFQDEP